MENYLTPSNITFVLGIMGTIFGIYIYFRKPQIDSDKKDALLDQSMKFLVESSEKRFSDIQDNFRDLLLQSNNHIHTVDTKVESLSASINIMANKLTELATIINERVPSKK